jgi:hypothetical protein
MRRLWMAALIVVVAAPLLAQAPAEKWTVGTVMGYWPHVAAAEEPPSPGPRFEITVRVGRTDYVVLYTQLPGTPEVEYSVGRDAPVLIGAKILSFRNKLGQKVDVPILKRMPAGTPPKKS